MTNRYLKPISVTLGAIALSANFIGATIAQEQPSMNLAEKIEYVRTFQMNYLASQDQATLGELGLRVH